MPNPPNTAPVSSIDNAKELEILLLDKYGPLMSTRDFADLLGIKEISVSNGFANNLPWTRPFRSARIKIGRRVYFITTAVVEALKAIQGKDLLRSTTPVRQVYVPIGTRSREKNSRIQNVRQVRNAFGNNCNSVGLRYGVPTRKSFHRSSLRFSHSGLGAFHVQAKIRVVSIK